MTWVALGALLFGIVAVLITILLQPSRLWMRTRSDPYLGWTDRGREGSIPDEERSAVIMRSTTGTAFPTHPGMVPKPKATSTEEHDALLYRIKHGHVEVEFVEIGGRDMRADEFAI